MAWRERGGKSGMDGTAFGVLTSTDLDGTEWRGRELPPIYRPAAGSWDEWMVSGPTVVPPVDGTWRLYYWGVGPGGQGIGLLTARDGNTWTPWPGNPAFKGDPAGWDESVLEPVVLYARGRFWMWYSGLREPLNDATAISIGLATSDDGLRWTRHPANPVLRPGPAGHWTDLRVLSPDVIVEPDGSLLFAAYGMSRRDPGKSFGTIGLWRSPA